MSSAKYNIYRAEATAAAGESTPPLVIPPRAAVITAAVHPNVGGTAIVYYTLDDADDVLANPGAARWVAWEAASVSASTVKAFAGPVVAVKADATAAPCTLQICVSFDR